MQIFFLMSTTHTIDYLADDYVFFYYYGYFG